jgi:hypothetical protein
MDLLRVPRILWSSLVVSTLILLYVTTRRPQPAGPPQAILLPVFALVAVSVIGVSFVLPARIYARHAAAVRVAITEAPDTGGSDVIPYREARRRRVFANPASARRTATMIFQTSFILGMALSENVALLGFALAWLGHSIAVYAPFFVVSWVLMALRFPTEKAVFGRFAQAKDAAFPS